jgi:hypothetical protein
MTERKPLSLLPIIAVFAVVLSFVAAYAGGYFWLGERADFGDKAIIFRSYDRQWLASAFNPAARVEGWITGKQVEVIATEDAGWTSFPPLSEDE